MNLKENGTVRAIVEKIKEIRRGNRMLADNDLSFTMSFFRKDQPDTKCGVVKVTGGYRFSLFDAGVFLISVFLISSVLRSVFSFFRRF